jgi:hypothetical protein
MIYRFRDKHANHYATDEPTIYRFRYKNANHYTTDAPMIYRFREKNAFISGIMVSVLVSKVVDRGFEPRLGQAKDFKISICCFSAKHTALRRKSKDWLVAISWQEQVNFQ